jgi:hypothetical protein
MGHRGPKPKHISLTVVKALAKAQLSDRKIAQIIGMDEATFCIRKQQSQELQKALKQGRNDIDLRRVEYLANLQCEIEEIGWALSIPPKRFQEMLDEREDLRIAIESGRSKTKTNIRQALYKLINPSEGPPNPQTAIFLAKATLGMTEKRDDTLTIRGSLGLNLDLVTQETEEDIDQAISRLLNERNKKYQATESPLSEEETAGEI